MPLVKVRDLQPGQVVASDVRNMHGQVILPAGTVVNQRVSTILKAWGVTTVMLPDEAPTMAADATASGTPVTAASSGESGEAGQSVLAELQSLVSRLARPAPALAGAVEVNPTAGTRRPSGQPISAETLVARSGTLASLPTIYFQVEKAINHPTSSAADIGKVLRNDQALCARLLRIANSAFYGFPRRVEGLDDAVRIIGTRQLHDLVLATVVLTQFKGVDPLLTSMPAFWRHSLACGIAARVLASLRRESNTERFFVAGLLHDLGSLVLYQQIPDRAREALLRHRQSDVALDEAEHAIIGCDHGQVGAALMNLWKLPEFYGEVASHHHIAVGRVPTVGTATVHVADLLVVALGLGSNGESRPPRFSAEAWGLLALAPTCLGQVAEQTLSVLGEAERVFLGEESTK